MNNKVLYGVLSLIGIVLVATGVYAYIQYSDNTSKNSSTNTTKTTEKKDDVSTNGDQSKEEVGSTSFKSEKGVMLVVNSPQVEATVVSPLKVAGTVPGSWSFEGQFMVRLLDANGNIIAEAPAKLDGDWMSQNQVPFSATLTFDAPESGSSGLLVLERDNPSGLDKNADSLSLMVRF